MITRIDIDGVDRTGKDTLCQYISILSNYKYIINTRGILSQLVYNEIHQRDVDYTNEVADNLNTLIIYLEADIEDLAIRAKTTNEPPRDFRRDRDVFRSYAAVLKNEGIEVWKYNTSLDTPYQIAKNILYRLEGNK